MAGIIGINPEPRTAKELYLMAMARQRSEWDRTASLLCTYIRANSKNSRVTPTSLNPFRNEKEEDTEIIKLSTKEGIQMLASAIKGKA